MSIDNKFAVMGKVTSVYGIKGWVKVISYTQPKENICSYKTWRLDNDGNIRSIKLSHCKSHGNGLVAQFDGCDNREQAQQYCGSLVTIPRDELPELPFGEFYWHQLQGLKVYIDDKLLGKVSHLMETGSNDVLVVKKCKGSIDAKERLIPYLPDQVVKHIDLEKGEVLVDWDPDF